MALQMNPLNGNKPTIQNSYKGIYTYYSSLDAYNVEMQVTHTGVEGILQPPTASTYVDGCTIDAVRYGINWTGNDGATLMYAGYNTITVSGDNKGIGIYMKELSTTARPYYYVDANTITVTDASSGISAINVAGLTAKGNIVTQNSATGSAPPTLGTYGIKLEGCEEPLLTCNNIYSDYDNTDAGSYGIFAGQTTNSYISCNGTHGHNVGIFFGGSCGGTDLLDNVMNNNFEGMHLNSNAEIGQQVQRGNTFIGNYGANINNPNGANNLNNIGQGLAASRMTVHQAMGTVNGTSSYYFPKIPLYDFGNLTFVPLYGSFGTSGGSDDWFIENPLGFPDACGSLSCNQALNGGGNEGYEKMIASGNTETVDFKPESKVMAEQYLFEKLSENDSLLQSDTIYQQYYSEKENTSTGKLFDVKENILAAVYDSVSAYLIRVADSLITLQKDSIHILNNLAFINYSTQRLALINSIGILQQAITNIKAQQQALINGKLNDALQVNQIVTPVEVPQTNQKIMNDVILNTKLQGTNFALSQITVVLPVAHQCPHSGGKAVYQARAFIEEYYSDTIVYNDLTTCLQDGIYRQAQTHKENKDVTVNDFTIQPNPANDNIVIAIKNKITGICKLELYNSLGAIVLATSFSSIDKTQPTDISNLVDGMYQVKITFNDERSFVSKLAIIR